MCDICTALGEACTQQVFPPRETIATQGWGVVKEGKQRGSPPRFHFSVYPAVVFYLSKSQERFELVWSTRSISSTRRLFLNSNKNR